MRIVFHVGVHKTASTLIQRTLAMNAANLRERGVFYVNAEMPFVIARQRYALRKLQTPWRSPPPKDALSALNAKILRRAERAGAHTVLVSEENRIGHPLYTELKLHGRGSFYPRAAACLAYVLAGLPHNAVELFMLTRRQGPLLRSLYGQGLRTLSTDLDLEGFCATVDWDRFRFDALANRIETAFPQLTLRMRRYETIQDGTAIFLRDTLRVMGVRPAGFSFPNTLVNSSPSAAQLQVLRQLAAKRIEQSEPERSLRRKARRVLSSGRDDGPRIELPAWAAAKCAELEAGDSFERNPGTHWRGLAQSA